MKKLHASFYIIIAVWAILFFGYFISHGAVTKELKMKDTWRIQISEQMTIAYMEFFEDIEKDFTDLGCELAEQKLNNKINDILLEHRMPVVDVISDAYGQRYKEMMEESSMSAHEPD